MKAHEIGDDNKLAQLKGLKGPEYRKAWNKINKVKCYQSRREWGRRNPGVLNERSMKKHGCSISSHANTESQKKATMSRQMWGPVEDSILTNGKYKESELVEILGRSIKAIQRRKWRLRQEELGISGEPS